MALSVGASSRWQQGSAEVSVECSKMVGLSSEVSEAVRASSSWG
jgi:hypothetical protein